MNQCANTQYLNQFLRQQEDDERRQTDIDAEVERRTFERLRSILPDDLLTTFTELPIDDNKPCACNRLFNDMTAQMAMYFNDQSHDNARDLGRAFGAYIMFNVHREEQDNYIDTES